MTDDLVSLKLLIVSEAAPEREILRRAALEAPIPIDVVEIGATGDATSASLALAADTFDIVLFDSRMPKGVRQTVLDAARAARGRPLAILIGAADMRTREVLNDGLDVDGLLAKPIDQKELSALIRNCIRARLPSRILIVDDSSTVRTVVRKVLQASRFRLNTEEAEAGAVAVELAGKQSFDIVFLDCHMPDVDGFATLDMLKTAHPETKVVMITGTRDIRIEQRARTEGARDFLYKPFFAKDIDAVLSRLYGLMPPRWN